MGSEGGSITLTRGDGTVTIPGMFLNLDDGIPTMFNCPKCGETLYQPNPARLYVPGPDQKGPFTEHLYCRKGHLWKWTLEESP